MTSQEYSEILEKDQTREKLINALQRDFPKYKSRAEDWAARAIHYGLRKVATLNDRTSALALVMEKATFEAVEELSVEIERRKALQGLPRAPKQRDPMRRIDFKVDLEKAIRLTTGNELMQQALWHIHFEEWTWEEVINELPKDVEYKTWEKRIQRINEDLQRRLRAYGYRG